MKKFLARSLAIAVVAGSAGSALAQGWSVAIEQNPMVTNCAGVQNIPVAAGSDCPTSITAAQNLFTTLVNTPNCLSSGCKPGETIQWAAPTCVPDPYTRPNGSPAIRWQIGLKWTCAAGTGTGTGQGQGLLKICKVAGPGVAVGTPFNFTIGSTTVTVPAGPAPGGTCMIGPSFPLGTHVTIAETIPAGDTVSNITVAPPNRIIGTPSLVVGSVDLTIGLGVTEVTYTDKRVGFLEICKRGDVTGNFNFTVNPGGLGPFSVPAGACSPPIEVPAGPVVIRELPSSGAVMDGCATIPPSQQGSCDPGTQTSTVSVVPGDISTMTIAIITDKKDVAEVVIPNLPMQGGNENTPCPQTGVVLPRAAAPSIPYFSIMLSNLDQQCSTKGPGFKLQSIKFLTCQPDPRGPGFGPNATADLTCGP